MKTQHQISIEVDRWIDEEDIPSRANFKAIRGFSTYEGMDEDEIEAYRDFMYWAIHRKHEAIMQISEQEPSDHFLSYEADGDLTLSFPFSSMDYERLHPDNFNRYHYRLQKIYERVNDLALLHSSISSEEGKKNTCERFKALVRGEFRNRVLALAEKYRKYNHCIDRLKMLNEIEKLNRQIRKCKEIWQKYAYWQ